MFGTYWKRLFFSILYGIFILACIAGGGAFLKASAAVKKNKPVISELEFKDATVQDAVRVVSELTGENIVATTEAGEKMVTLFVRNLGVTDVVDAVCRIAGLWYRHNPKTGIYVVMTTEEYQRDIVVFRDEPTRMFKLKYMNVGVAARTIADLFGDRVELKGKADRHLGDDYVVSNTYTRFTSNYDEGKMGDEEDDDDDDEESSSKNKTNEKDLGVQGLELTPEQLARLSRSGVAGNSLISAGVVGQVAQRTEAPIYVTVNRMHNMLFVRTADEKAMAEIAGIIKDSDQQVPEVLLEMKVLEVELTDQFESAFDLSQISGSQQTGPDDGHNANPLNQEATSSGRTLLGLGNFDVQEGSTMIFQVLSGNLRMRLQLLQDNNNIRSLATPMLLAANNHPARLFIGEETIITTGFRTQVVESTTTTGVVVNNVYPVPVTEKENVGNTLTILPSINADRSVVMRIAHENSTVNVNGGKIPLLVGGSVENVPIDTIDTSNLEGTVLAQDGMTVAVGGMMRTSYTDTESKVPVLGDIPGLGFFFKNQQKIQKKTELVLLITPHVLTAPKDGQDISRDRLSELDYSSESVEAFPVGVKEGAGEALTGLPAMGVPADGADDRKRFIDMTSVAVKQLRLPFDLRQPKGNVRPVHMAALGHVRVFDYRGITTEPIAAWTDGRQYTTALKVTNTTPIAHPLDVAALNRPWLAATLEKQELARRGKAGDFTYLYLISSRSFEQEIRLTGHTK
ncbi:MAG: DUF3438 family protein [Desulfobacter sp.]|nr:MAG: DUF3438 family protein [Desulfobacter sp.]